MHLRRTMVAFAFVIVPSVASAQDNHARGHADYMYWSSGKVAYCCNNVDCGSLSDDTHRQTADGPQVLIDGEWCRVEPQHYLVRGHSPDWAVAHACVGRTEYWRSRPPCERLLCYVGKGGF
jgi:hypothetical protein